MARYMPDLTGQTFGKLTALSEVAPKYRRNGRMVRRWLCRCACGRELEVQQQGLRGGNSKSCGKGECHSMFGTGGSRSPRWAGDSVTYIGAHHRVYAERGAAAGYPCVDCGATSDDAQWSLDWREAMAGPVLYADAPGYPHHGCAYSPNTSDYQSRCTPCHIELDRSIRQARKG